MEFTDIFEFLASLNDAELMNNFYSDPSWCICTFRFLNPTSQSIIYKLLFWKDSVSLKSVKKWPKAKDDVAYEAFDFQLEKLKRLKILNIEDDSWKLNEIFSNNIKLVISSRFELSLVKEKSSKENNAPSPEELIEHSKTRLSKIIFYMLNEINHSDMPDFVKSLLISSNFVESNGITNTLTVDGFRFILEDISTQIHILLLNYIRLKKTTPHVLKLIFQLTLSTENSYKINENSEIDQDELIEILLELKHIGLIYMKK